MKRPASPSCLILAGALALAMAGSAQARNDSIMSPIAAAMAKKEAREIAGDMPLLWGSASAAGSELMPGAIDVEGEASVIIDPRSRVHLTDAETCQKAFEDALFKLTTRARASRAAAVVGIVSNFKGQRVDDARSYDCHAGSSKSYVTLQARLASTFVPPGSPALPPATGFASLDDVKAVPISATGQERYAHFLTLPKPRAFVVYEDGNWRFYSRDPEAMTKALDYCARQGKRCWLYAADDRVVWSADVNKRIGASSQLTGGTPAEPKDDHQ